MCLAHFSPCLGRLPDEGPAAHTVAGGVGRMNKGWMRCWISQHIAVCVLYSKPGPLRELPEALSGWNR